MSADEHFDVMIVGCGPVGMVLATLLSNESVRVLAVEREREIGYQPRARHLDGEAMRVLQTIGIAEQCEEVMPAFGGGLKLVDADGGTLLEQKFDATRRGSQGWFDDYQMFQPLLLGLLHEHLSHSDTGSLRTTHEVKTVTQQADHVRVELLNHAAESEVTVTASYLVGCDGAASIVRRQAGCELQRLGPDHPFVVIDATPLRDDFALPDPTYSKLVCDPRRPHYVSPGNGAVPMRFEFMVLPGDDPGEMVAPSGLARLTEPYLSEGDVRFDRAGVYVFHSLLVDQWRVGRILLAGDAAHVQPPFMGQGLCSGFRDVSNLAWKLAMVCHGRARDQLLDTYQSERSPHARDWINESNRIGGIVMTTDELQARVRNQRMLAGEFRELRPITPRLGPGLTDELEEPVGTLAPQPMLEGRRLDDTAGYRFEVAASPEIWGEVPEELREAVTAAAHVFLVPPDSGAAESLRAHFGGAAAVVVRPDRYVLAVAADASELERGLRAIPSIAG